MCDGRSLRNRPRRVAAILIGRIGRIGLGRIGLIRLIGRIRLIVCVAAGSDGSATVLFRL